MHLKRIRAGMFGVLLLLAVGLIIPPFATSQTPLFSLFQGGRLRPSEGPTKHLPGIRGLPGRGYGV
jgi:accessory gene regulator protein AgrB